MHFLGTLPARGQELGRVVKSRQHELAALLEHTRKGLSTGLVAEFKEAWSSIAYRIEELQTALREWQGAASAEVKDNITALTQVIVALREKIIHAIEELKSSGLGDSHAIIEELKQKFEDAIEEVLTAMDGLVAHMQAAGVEA